MGIMSKVRGLLGGPVGAGVSAPARGPRADYMRGGRGVTFSNWRPPLRDAQEQIGEAWEDAVARATDAVQNSGWLAGAIDQAVANTVGTGLRLKVQPENSLFGMSKNDERQWSRLVEQRFELWAHNPQECDIQGTRSFAKMQSAAFRSWLLTGEVLAELAWRKRPWNTWGTKVRLLQPQRLSRKSEPMQRLINGVYTDSDGMPIGYLGKRSHPLFGIEEYRVRARDSYGRSKIVHLFDGMPGTYRGISPLVPALQVVRQFDQLSDATLMAAVVQTLFAATITGDEPTEDTIQGLLTPQEQAAIAKSQMSPMEAYLDAIEGYYDGATFDVGINGRIGHLFPGQELKFHTNENQASNYKEFSLHLLREFCRCLGLTYESGTGDYEGATYSSVRMATGEIFTVTKMRRDGIVAPFCQAAYEAWLEEEIERGDIPFPGGIEGFLANRAAATRAAWRGSPKPQADDIKIAKAHEIWQRIGVMSDEMIANEIGVDIEDVYAARAGERAMRTEYGLPEPMQMPAQGGAPIGPVGDDDEDEDEDEDET